MPDGGPAFPGILFVHLLVEIRVDHGRNFGPSGFGKPDPCIIMIKSNATMA